MAAAGGRRRGENRASPQTTRMALHLDQVRLLEVDHLELADHALEELLLPLLEVALGLVLEDVQEVDVALGQRQVQRRLVRGRVVDEPELDDDREIEQIDDGAELEGRKE